MKSFFYIMTLQGLVILFSTCLLISCKNYTEQPAQKSETIESSINKDGYDSPMERYMLEIYKTTDPALGRVPIERLWTAINQAHSFKTQFHSRTEAVAWTERGPISDVVGPSNGNSRGQAVGSAANTVTSGRIRGVLIDANDATGNTVWTGGVAGGLWKTTNFLSASPTWVFIDDFFSNMAISSICQSPADPMDMYFSTGEPTANADAVLGNGIWKSTDGGITWSHLASTNGVAAFQRTFKLLCDASGNLFAARRGNGLVRSNDQGVTWTVITPPGVFASCTDIELSSSGRLHASFGYNTGSGASAANYRYTDIPATVTSAVGWNSAVAGLPSAVNTGNRMELACLDAVVYGAFTNNSNNVYAIYRSIDGGTNWVRQNAVDYTSALSNTQGWYNISLGIDPTDVDDIMVGGLDAYRSSNGGSTITRHTFWVGLGNYVHADHHEVIYRFTGGQNRILMATDGGLFLSTDDGATFVDKNVGLRLKQFYSGILHPNSSTNTNYIIGGTQDNGTHQLNAPGLTTSVEVTGGDGAYVDISPVSPTIHWGAYVFNNYRLSINNGLTWSAVNWSNNGRFINPFVYDGTTDILYGAQNLDGINRVTNASNTSLDASTIVTLTGLFQPSAFKLSPYTANRLFVGSGPGSFSASGGKLYRVDNANTIASGTPGDANVTNITSASWLTSYYLNCVNVGTTDNHLVATFTNYGINNVWVSTDGGANWTAVDGTGANALPDMPVRWAIFPPGDNTKLIIATEAGVYTTSLINGTSTQWFPSTGFPTVRTDMLQLRAMDNTIVAATHGRGMWTGNLLAVLPLNKLVLQGSLLNDGRALLRWVATDPSSEVKYRLQYGTDGIQFTDIAELPSGVLSFRHNLNDALGYYRVVGIEPARAPVFSNIVLLRSSSPKKGIFVSLMPNVVRNSAQAEITGLNGNYTWQLVSIDGKLMRTGKGNSSPGTTLAFTLNTEALQPGMYRFNVTNNRETKSAVLIKL